MKSNRQKAKKQTKTNSNFKLTCHYVAALSVPAGGVREILIAPTLNLFSRAS